MAESDDDTTVDDYLDTVPAQQRAALSTVRGMLLRIIPGVSETISYGIPVFTYRGRGLVGLSATPKGCSLHLMSTAVAAELDGSLLTGTITGSTIRFTEDEPLDEQTVRLVVDLRIADIERR